MAIMDETKAFELIRDARFDLFFFFFSSQDCFVKFGYH